MLTQLTSLLGAQPQTAQTPANTASGKDSDFADVFSNVEDSADRAELDSNLNETNDKTDVSEGADDIVSEEDHDLEDAERERFEDELEGDEDLDEAMQASVLPLPADSQTQTKLESTPEPKLAARSVLEQIALSAMAGRPNASGQIPEEAPKGGMLHGVKKAGLEAAALLKGAEAGQQLTEVKTGLAIPAGFTADSSTGKTFDLSGMTAQSKADAKGTPDIDAKLAAQLQAQAAQANTEGKQATSQIVQPDGMNASVRMVRSAQDRGLEQAMLNKGATTAATTTLQAEARIKGDTLDAIEAERTADDIARRDIKTASETAILGNKTTMAAASEALTKPSIVANPAAVQNPSSSLVEEEGDSPELTPLSPASELRSGAISALATGAGTMTKADPAMVMRQIAEGIQKMSDGRVELRLSPEELGSVRMQFVQSEQGMTVHIQADRPETLDLLRRHIDQLARDLADSGFDATGFSFGDEGEQKNQHQLGSGAGDVAPEEQLPPEPLAASAQDGLDIRM